MIPMADRAQGGPSAKLVVNYDGMVRPEPVWLPNPVYEINRSDEYLPPSGRHYHCRLRQSDEQDSLELNEDGVLREITPATIQPLKILGGSSAIQRSSAIKLAELRRQFVKFVPELLCMQG